MNNLFQEAMALVAEERRHQIADEGFDAAHDDEHIDGELAAAAACYLQPEPFRQYEYNHGEKPNLKGWPWLRQWWKPNHTDRKREVVKGLALGVAELERILRSEG